MKIDQFLGDKWSSR